MRVHWQRCATAGLISFFLSWLAGSIPAGLSVCHDYWHSMSDQACQGSLRIIYLASRRVVRDAARPDKTVQAMKRVLYAGFPVSREEMAYRRGRKLWVERRSHTALLCSQDPYIATKALLVRTMEFEPSYQIWPDAQTVAYCPYHHLRLLTDGRIVRGETP